MSSAFRSLDRLIGILCTVAGSVALVVFQRWMIKKTKSMRIQADALEAEKQARSEEESKQKQISEVELVEHFGSCHCEKSRFRILAPRHIRVIDKSSKIRYPRVSIPAESFELLSDEKVISMYPVQTDKIVSVHTFCSFCGVNILYSPSINPVTVEINVDCLDKTNIEQMTHTGVVDVCDAVSCASFLEYHHYGGNQESNNHFHSSHISPYSSPPIGMDRQGNINSFSTSGYQSYSEYSAKGIGHHAGPPIDALLKVQDYLISEFSVNGNGPHSSGGAVAQQRQQPQLLENVNMSTDGLSLAMRGSQEFLSFISPAKKTKYFEQVGYMNRGNNNNNNNSNNGGDGYFNNHFNINYSGDKNNYKNGSSKNLPYGGYYNSNSGYNSSGGSSSGGSSDSIGAAAKRLPTTFNDVNDLTNRFINAYNANTDLSNITSSGTSSSASIHHSQIPSSMNSMGNHYSQNFAPQFGLGGQFLGGGSGGGGDTSFPRYNNYPGSSMFMTSRQGDTDPAFSHVHRGSYSQYNSSSNNHTNGYPRGHFDDDSTLFSTIATLGTSQNESFWKNRSLRDESVLGQAATDGSSLPSNSTTSPVLNRHRSPSSSFSSSSSSSTSKGLVSSVELGDEIASGTTANHSHSHSIRSNNNSNNINNNSDFSNVDRNEGKLHANSSNVSSSSNASIHRNSPRRKEAHTSSSQGRDDVTPVALSFGVGSDSSESGSGYSQSATSGFSRRPSAEILKNKESLDDEVGIASSTNGGTNSGAEESKAASTSSDSSSRGNSKGVSSSSISIRGGVGHVDESASFKAAKAIRSMQSPKSSRKTGQQSSSQVGGSGIQGLGGSENIDVNVNANVN